MDLVKRLLCSKQELHVGSIALGVSRDAPIDIFQLVCKLVLRYMRTGKIENCTDSLERFLLELVKTDCAAKWDWFMRRWRARDYVVPSVIAMCPLVPLVSLTFVQSSARLGLFGRSVSFRLSLPRPVVGLKGGLTRLAAGMALIPICALAAYATLPREKLSTYRLRTEAREHMEDEAEATECLVVEKAKSIKGTDGEDILTGSRLLKVTASTGRRRRRPYAAKVAQVARAKVGYLKNTPENRLIYQRVLLEIMDKDCVRYVDRDVILPLAVGCCFVYPEGVEETAGLWGSQESLGLK